MHRPIWVSVALTLAISHVAAAQNLRLDPVTTETRTLTGSCKTGATVSISAKHDGLELELPQVMCPKGTFELKLKPIQFFYGDTVTVEQVSAAAGRPDAMTLTVSGDAREDFETSAFIGFAIDTFAAEDIQNYLNQTANGKPQERGIFGFDFAYRLLDSTTAVGKKNWTKQIWVYGETVHGARSADVDCERNPDFPTCLDATAELAALGRNIPKNALYMLRNATSLEGFVGIRAELLTLNITHKNPAALYVKGELGFVNVAGSDGDAKDVNHWALGLTTTGGLLKGSYLEVGHGRTDLFSVNRYKRYIFDGYLQHKVKNMPFSFFGQIVADVDMGRGADALQPYFGLTFELDCLFAAAKICK